MNWKPMHWKTKFRNVYFLRSGRWTCLGIPVRVASLRKHAKFYSHYALSKINGKKFKGMWTRLFPKTLKCSRSLELHEKKNTVYDFDIRVNLKFIHLLYRITQLVSRITHLNVFPCQHNIFLIFHASINLPFTVDLIVARQGGKTYICHRDRGNETLWNFVTKCFFFSCEAFKVQLI